MRTDRVGDFWILDVTAPTGEAGPEAARARVGEVNTATTTSRPATTWASLVRAVFVALASVLLGGLTFFAQGFLPGWFTSFANSASGWTLLTTVLVVLAGLPAGRSALLGAISFVLLTQGYSWAAALEGLYYNPMLFSIIGVLVGPFVGLAACWLRQRGLRAALATAALTGVAVGESIHGLTVVADTTSPVYWILIGLAGLALLTLMLISRIRGWIPVVTASAGSAVVSTAFLVLYSSIGAA